MNTKKNNKINKTKNHNKTKKYSQKELQVLCRKSANTYNQFEKDLSTTLLTAKKNLNYQKELIKAFHTPYAPSAITPQDDFYTYINYTWIAEQTKKSNKEKKYYTQIDSFRIVQEKVYYELIDIVKEYTANNKSKKSEAIKNVYLSMLRLDEKVIEDNIQLGVEVVDGFLEAGDLLKFLAHINRNEIVAWGCPLVWNVQADQKNSKIYRSSIAPPELSIYDYLVYIEDEAEDQNTKKYKAEFKKEYFKYLREMFDACLGKNHGLKPQDVWDVEYAMLNDMGCDSVKNEDTEDYYNIVTSKDSLEKYGFDWKKFTEYLGYEKTPNFYICTSLNYLKCIMKTLQENWQTPKWRTYFLYIYLRQKIRFHKKWRVIHYDFFGKFVQGQPTMIPLEIYPIFALSICFNTFLTNEYVSKNKKQEHIDYVENMGQDLLTVFKRKIEKNTWLSPKTKKYALLKLKYLKLIIGSPKILREDPLLDYSPTDAWDNLRKLAKWRTNKFVKLDGKPVIDIPEVAWNRFKLIGTQAYVVNAYYTPTQNSIYVPLAYLQKPFIDLDERGIEYNLAHVGYTLGHEMSHCLDDMGSKYDYNGNLANWWTPEDRKKFNAKVKNVIEQYETFAAYDGIKMDASLSTGENLADISGLAICEAYLRDFQLKNNDIIPICALSFEAFYTYIAIQSRQKIYKQAVKAQLKINPHPLDKYRTNCPLARLKIFSSIYNIKKGDKMYWESKDTIW